MEIPSWVDHVKTAKAKELAPYDPDWLYVRAASLARKIYIRKGTGVRSFEKVYGRQQRRGVQRNISSTASGKVIRFCLQQLEEMGFIATDETNGGRYMTSEGNREFDKKTSKTCQKHWKSIKFYVFWSKIVFFVMIRFDLIAKRVADEMAGDDEEEDEFDKSFFNQKKRKFWSNRIDFGSFSSKKQICSINFCTFK